MATQLFKNLGPYWVQLEDLFTVEDGTAYVLESEVAKSFELAVTEKFVAPVGTGHIVQRPVIVTPSAVVSYWIKSWPSSSKTDILLTPSTELSYYGGGSSGGADTRFQFEDGNLQVANNSTARRTFDVHFHQETGDETALTVVASVGDRSITVSDTSGFSVGGHILVQSASPAPKAFFADIVSVGNATQLTVNVPVDAEFPVGAEVVGVTHDMNIDGSTTPQVFKVRGFGSNGDLGFKLNVTRVMLMMTTSGSPVFTSFGDIAGGLDNGLLLRLTEDADNHNMWVAKTNADIALLSYDLTPYTAGGFFSVNGLSARNSYAGESKHGSVIEVEPGENLELMVQDDLSSIVTFKAMIQGYISAPD